MARAVSKRKAHNAQMRAKYGDDWWKRPGFQYKKPKPGGMRSRIARIEALQKAGPEPEIRGSSVWQVTRKGAGVSYYKSAVIASEQGPDFVGTAYAEPRRGFGRWPYEIHKEGSSYVVPSVDFPENRGPHPTLQATMEAIQNDSEMTGT